MKKIKEPSFSLADLYGKCTATIRCEEARGRLDRILSQLVRSEALYRRRAAAAELYQFAEAGLVGDVTSDELSKLYTQTFAREGGPTRDLYELLRKAPGNICPLCNQRVVGTLDHYLPKARHPAFSVTPLNLVPACKDCNIDSKQKRPASAEEQTLHPYFDDVNDEVWLVADVVAGSPPAIAFYTRDVGSWPAIRNSIVRSHFATYKLGSLYADHAGAELVNVYVDLDAAGILNNPAASRAHLELEASRRRRAFRNSWQAALYEALGLSTWFCTSGIHEVRKSELFPEDYD